MKTQFVSMISHEAAHPVDRTSVDSPTRCSRRGARSNPTRSTSSWRSSAPRPSTSATSSTTCWRSPASRRAASWSTSPTSTCVHWRSASPISSSRPPARRRPRCQVSGSVVLRADPNRVEQVLRNLLDNARKYGGDRVGIESFPRGDSHVVVVADNGHGVPEEARERIFEQFEQVSQGRQPHRDRGGPGTDGDPTPRRGHGRTGLVRTGVPGRAHASASRSLRGHRGEARPRRRPIGSLPRRSRPVRRSNPVRQERSDVRTGSRPKRVARSEPRTPARDVDREMQRPTLALH